MGILGEIWHLVWQLHADEGIPIWFGLWMHSQSTCFHSTLVAGGHGGVLVDPRASQQSSMGPHLDCCHLLNYMKHSGGKTHAGPLVRNTSWVPAGVSGDRSS